VTKVVARPLVVVGAATSAGAYGPGQERAPDLLRAYGLVDRLRAGGREVRDAGNVASATYRPDPDHPRARNVEEVRDAARAVATEVAASMASGSDVLVIGGDCTVELGTVAGAARGASSVGLVYIDLDGDLNTPDTGDGVLDWMGLAHVLGIPGCEPRLVRLGDRVPLLEPGQVYLVAADRLTDAEHSVVNRLGLRRAPLAAVEDRLTEVLDGLTAWAAGFDRVLVHVDVDVLDYRAFPIAEEVREVPGLSFGRLAELTRGLRQMGQVRALTVCEVNPDHARHEAQYSQLVELIAAAI
jgi:arginase